MDAGHEAAEDDVATMVDTNCVALARMWAKIDLYAHKARTVDMTVKV